MVCEKIHDNARDWAGSILQVADTMIHPTVGEAVGTVNWDGTGDVTHSLIRADQIGTAFAGEIAAKEAIHAALQDYGHDDESQWLETCGYVQS